MQSKPSPPIKHNQKERRRKKYMKISSTNLTKIAKKKQEDFLFVLHLSVSPASSGRKEKACLQL